MAGAGSDRSDLASLDDALERMAAEQAGTFDAPDDVIGGVRDDLERKAPFPGRMPGAEQSAEPDSASSIDDALAGASHDLSGSPRAKPADAKSADRLDADSALEQLSDDVQRAIDDLDDDDPRNAAVAARVESDVLDESLPTPAVPAASAPTPADDAIDDLDAPDDAPEGADSDAPEQSIDEALAATSAELDADLPATDAPSDEAPDVTASIDDEAQDKAAAGAEPIDAEPDDQAPPEPVSAASSPSPEAESDEPAEQPETNAAKDAEDPEEDGANQPAAGAARAAAAAAMPAASHEDLAGAFDEVESPGGEGEAAAAKGLAAAAAAAAAARQAAQEPVESLSPIARVQALGARVLLLANAPFAGMSRQSIDTVGWIALITLFNAVCLLAIVLLR